MLDQMTPAAVAPPGPELGARMYEISAAAPFGAMLSSTPTRDGVLGQRCYRVLHDLDAPCPGCPALGLAGQAGPVMVVRRLQGDGIELVRAERTAGMAIRVLVCPVDDHAVSDLVAARMAALVERSGLTPRERDVFELILLGRAHAQIASALEIGVRTVKFHQRNLQRKIGFESRLDLSRLLL